MLFFIAVSHFIDAIKCVVTGVARGCGWQKKAVFVNLGAHYLFGVPSGIVLVFVFHFGGKVLFYHVFHFH